MGAGRGDTIFALSSAPGRAGIAVIRVSGNRAGPVLAELTSKSLPGPRRAVLRAFRARSGEAVDQGLVLWFPKPASFTGEDCAELHVHGGRAVLDALFSVLVGFGLRPAEPGEFTRRAVENGKLDLTRAEAIADLVDAETEGQRRQALRQYDGELLKRYEGWRDGLTGAMALAEASIDFSDEELPGDLAVRAKETITKIIEEIQEHIADGRRGELLREGLYLTVIGPPNAGKSSLVNTLSKRDVAIVSEIEGTTRDVLEVHLDLAGYPVILADTAGLRTTTEVIEAEGVRRALARAEAADLVLLLLDGSTSEPLSYVSRETMAKASLVAWNKADLPWPKPQDGLKLSLKTGEGLAELVQAISDAARQKLESPRASLPLTRARHRVALEEAVVHLERARVAQAPELFAEDIRLAVRAIGRITGSVDIEQVLDLIFREFCIGK